MRKAPGAERPGSFTLIAGPTVPWPPVPPLSQSRPFTGPSRGPWHSGVTDEAYAGAVFDGHGQDRHEPRRDIRPRFGCPKCVSSPPPPPPPKRREMGWRMLHPGILEQDKSSRGARLGPQRVRMCKGERPMGAAKGTQLNTEALCHPPPPRSTAPAPPVPLCSPARARPRARGRGRNRNCRRQWTGKESGQPLAFGPHTPLP